MLKKINGAIHSINSAALLLGAASLLSRALGILRDRLLASHFGASRELDMYYAAFQVPDLLYNIFLLGAAATAIIPVFMEINKKSEEEAKSLIRNLLSIFVFAAVIISILIVVAMPFFIKFATPGFSDAERTLTATLARIMMISPIFLGMSGIISAVTQSFRRFLAFAASPIFYNLGIILGILFFLPIFGLPGLALGVILGAFLHLAIQLQAFAGLGFVFSLNGSRKLSEPVIKIMKLSFPRVIASSINNLTAIFLVAIGSTLIAGSITVYQFANNLGGLPIGIFGVSFAIASFPALSEHFLKKDKKAFFETFYGCVRSILFYVLPLSIFFYVLRAQIVRMALGTGRFDWIDTRLTAASLGIMVLAIFAHSLTPILIRFFYALGNTKKPLFINVFTAALTVLLALLFVDILSGQNWFRLFFTRILRVGDLEQISILGIALAISLGALLDLGLLLSSALKEAKYKFGLKNKRLISLWVWGEFLKMLASALVAGLAAFGGLRLAIHFVTLDTFLAVFFQTAVSFLAGALVYIIFLYWLGNKETVEILQTIKRKTIDWRPKFLLGELEEGGMK